MSHDSSSIFAGERRGYIFAAVAVGVGIFGYFAYKTIKKSQSTVIKVDASALDKADETLIDDMFQIAAFNFGKLLNSGKASNQVAMTAYSLFKQQKDGDADEFDRNKEVTKPERYQAWDQ